MEDEIKSLANNLQANFPKTIIKLEIFPSGAVMIDIKLCERLFVLDYSPSYGICVDEVKDDEGFNMGYRFCSQDFDLARKKLYELLYDASSQKK